MKPQHIETPTLLDISQVSLYSDSVSFLSQEDSCVSKVTNLDKSPQYIIKKRPTFFSSKITLHNTDIHDKWIQNFGSELSDVMSTLECIGKKVINNTKT